MSIIAPLIFSTRGGSNFGGQSYPGVRFKSYLLYFPCNGLQRVQSTDHGRRVSRRLNMKIPFDGRLRM
jgi:hypothetical protein